MKSFDVASADVKKIREVMNGRIGEIIKEVIGNDTLQKIFEQPEHNEKYIEQNLKGTPSGIIALELGIVDAETKNALLLAQAAERTARNAERMTAIAQDQSAPEDWIIDMHGEVFKFVGSDRDPKFLQEAQATWQLSQIFLNTAYHDATYKRSDNAPLADTIYMSPNASYSESFLKTAAGYYSAAADILEHKGFEDAATKLKAISQSLLPENDISLTPHDIAKEYTNTEQRYLHEMYVVMGSDRYTTDDNVKLGEKLTRLTEGQKVKTPAPTSTNNYTP